MSNAYISVLLPSRGRPEMVKQTGDQLLALADRPETVEIILGLDQDDARRDEYQTYGIMWVAHERMGYGRLHEYYNQLAKYASGEWMLLWNDDVFMTTKGWDTVLAGLPASTLVADLQSEHTAAKLCCFPAVRRDAVAAVGGFSPHTPHCDTYWQDLGRGTGRITEVPIVVNHRRFDLSGNHNDETYAESKSNYKSAEYYGPVVQDAIRRDIEIIRRLA